MKKYSSIAINGAIWSFAQTIVERTIQLAVFLVAARQLGPHDFGVAALAVGPTAIFIATLEGITAAAVQKREVSEDYFSSCFAVSLLWGCTFGVASLALAPILAAVTHESGLVPLAAACGVAPVAAAFGTIPEAKLTRDFQFKFLAIRRSVGILAGGVVCIAMSLLGFGAWSLVAQTISVAVANTVASLLATRWRPPTRFKLASVSVVLRETSYFMGGNALSQGTTRIGDIAVGAFAGSTQAGIFRLCRTVLDLVTSLIFTPVARILNPVFARMADDEARLAQAASRVVSVALLLFGTATVGMILTADLAPVLLGSKWQGIGGNLSLLAASLPTLGVIMPLQSLLFASGHQRLNFYVNLAQLILNTVAVCVGATLAGAMGANAGFTARSYATLLIVIVCAWQSVPALKRINWRETAQPFALIALSVGAGALLLKLANGQLGPLGAFCVGAFSAALFAALMAITDRSIRTFVNDLASKAKGLLARS